MAIRYKGEAETFKGAVLTINERYWLDGMLEETAVVWNSEKQEIEYISVGYYGCDGRNMNECGYEADATKETWRQVLRYLRPAAERAFADSVTDYKRSIHIGTHAEVIRGKKVPKGTKVEVFWIGEKETFQSRKYYWMHETETIAGCYDEAGNKLWIKAEYLKNIDPLKSPNAKERQKFIQWWITEKAKSLGAPFKLRQSYTMEDFGLA